MFHFDPSKEFNYVGEFWDPDNPINSFPGTLVYSPDKGLSLKIITEPLSEELFSSSNGFTVETLHGMAEEIGRITLRNCVPNGGNTRLGKDSYAIKNFFVQYVIVGIFCQREDLVFKGISFHFLEMDSFCHPFPENYFIADDTPLVECLALDGLNIKINQGLRNAIDLDFALHSYGGKYPQELLAELQEKTNRMRLTKPFFCINVGGDNKTSGDYLQIRLEIEKLFSLFFLKSVHSDFTKIEDDKNQYYVIESKKIKTHKSVSLHFLPVTIHNIKERFADILKRWHDMRLNSLLNMLISDKLYGNAQPGYQQYCIIVALIGSWQVSNGSNKDYSKRYENFFNENLLPSDKLNDSLLLQFKTFLGQTKSLNELASDVGEIRNCILHIDSIPKTSDKYIKYKGILEDESKVKNLCEILFIVIIKAVYSELGIDLEEHQKENLLRYLVSWQTISL